MIVHLTNIMVLSCARQESTQRSWHRRGLLTRCPLLCTTPPELERPEDFNNKAEMSRFPPIRSQKIPEFRKIGTIPAKRTLFTVSIMQNSSLGRRGDTQGGRICSKRPLGLSSLVTFLFSDKKVTSFPLDKRYYLMIAEKVPVRVHRD